MMQLDPQQLWLLFFLLLVTGLCIGSFLNVVIYRLPKMLELAWQKEARDFLQLEPAANEQRFNLAFPSSRCPACNAPIKPWQNIPVLSFLFLRGRCAKCKTPISMRYPLVEAATGLASVLLLLQFGPGWQLAAMLVLTWISIALIGIDYDHKLLPDNLTMPLLWMGLLLNSQGLFVSLEQAVFGAAAGYGVLWLVFWGFKLATGKEGMGYGDFKLLAAYGAWFGWMSIPNIILLSSLTGAVIGLLLIALFRHESQKPIPFGPFIAVAAWLTVVYPQYFNIFAYL